MPPYCPSTVTTEGKRFAAPHHVMTSDGNRTVSRSAGDVE
jgi:hypothetical protein